jgi:pimeloyl-ACP methyl ester carboxylesterase
VATVSGQGSRRVVFLPGGVTPVAASYAPLLAKLGTEIDPVLKDLEVYATDRPPEDYSIGMEVDGLRRTVDDEGLAEFHLVGYSGGGAVALAFAARYPERLTSLAIFEPANLPGAWDEGERQEWHAFTAGLATLPQDEMLAEFTRRHLRPGVAPPAPPPGPAPEWMAKRPAGLNAMMAAFRADDTDREALRHCVFPVYLAHGLLTGEYMLRRIQRLAGLLPDVWIEAYEGVHHFGPPQRTHPARYAEALRWLWTRAEQRQAVARSGDETYAA